MLFGISEVYHQRQWGTVCQGYWDIPDAKVACRQLGFAKAVGASHYGRGTELGQWGTVCHSDFDMRDAKVACHQLGYAKTVGYWWYGRGSGKVWLFILEVYHQSQWGTVGRNGWYTEEAQVTCRQIGFTKAVGFSWEGRGTGKVWVNYMACTGSESSLGSCPHDGWGNVGSGCNTHQYDAGIV
ncbi:scavenger receptor cysteine-rich type 1 protein M130-like [Actinia tenebrosa]|uniref:Scavenger receptor cysteine-rich type 1 protein M130-like n=1 Tax=Actinia tenebrosa TaxID=6105 RepID=A0A6P8HB80_ACTTE|nr:scavenger receptor cysteine-rich type 1 protein M130-like [Actinia tenebrosa]